MGSDGGAHVNQVKLPEFQSTLPAWGATACQQLVSEGKEFQSTLPAWGATACQQLVSEGKEFQSTLPAWGATPPPAPAPTSADFNPRSPRGERRIPKGYQFTTEISIHAPRVGSDNSFAFAESSSKEFQSTLPAWGATPSADCSFRRSQFQSTLPAWGATPCIARDRRLCRFQSTLPAWGATEPMPADDCALVISIHAPRVGSDAVAIVPAAAGK